MRNFVDPIKREGDPVASNSKARPGSWYKWELVWLCWLAFFLQQADRQVYNVVLTGLRADLGLTDEQLGLIAMGFTLFYGLLVPVAGCLGDIFSRKAVVIGSLVIFSVGTVLTGLSNGMIGLLIFRSIATGGGEALYFPAANSLIGKHHESTRARALGIHQTAQYVGIVASSLIAGWIAARWGWRHAFYVFGVAGVVLAVVMAIRLQPDRGGSGEHHWQLMKESVGVLVRTPTFLLITLAFGCMGFVYVGFLTWIPTYLIDEYQLKQEIAAFYAMSIHYAGAVVAVTIGARLSDRLVQRRPAVRLEMVALGLILATPFLYLLGSGGSLTTVTVALAMFGLFRGLADANWVAGLFDVVPVRYRSSALGWMLAFAFVVGSLAPWLLGKFKPENGMGDGLSAMSALYVLSALLVWVASIATFPRDRQKAAIAGSGTG